MTQTANGQKPTWEDIEPFAVGVLGLCELETELRTRLDANLEVARTAMKSAQAEPWVKGSTGQPKPHPGFALAKACDEMALALYREITSGVDELIPKLAKLLS